MSENTETQVILGPEGVRAVNVLIAAAGVAQQKGAYSLEDAKHVFDAVKTLAPKAFEKPIPEVDEQTEAAS